METYIICVYSVIIHILDLLRIYIYIRCTYILCGFPNIDQTNPQIEAGALKQTNHKKTLTCTSRCPWVLCPMEFSQALILDAGHVSLLEDILGAQSDVQLVVLTLNQI